LSRQISAVPYLCCTLTRGSVESFGGIFGPVVSSATRVHKKKPLVENCKPAHEKRQVHEVRNQAYCCSGSENRHTVKTCRMKQRPQRSKLHILIDNNDHFTNKFDKISLLVSNKKIMFTIQNLIVSIVDSLKSLGVSSLTGLFQGYNSHVISLSDN